ncbi:uncharacterized protein [Amphiura filiformis]|uniref:uncharacterized protein n=1 Tax=Amphiura filiformis TaxID=82378 RepID=UPI003B222617
MTEVKIDRIGTAIMKSLSKNRFEYIRHFEDEITQQTRVPCFIEVNMEQGVLVIYIATHSKMLAEEEVKKSLDKIKAKSQREHVEIPVGTYGSVRQVVKSGGATGFVLMDENDYVTVEWSGVSEDMPAEVLCQVLEEMFIDEDDIVDVVKYPNHFAAAKQGKWGKTTFVSAEKAKEAVNMGPDIDPSGVISVQPILPEKRKRGVAGNLHSLTFYTRVTVTWYTRQSKGHAFINCDSYEDAVYVRNDLDGTQLGGKHIRCKMNNKNNMAVFVCQLDKDVVTEELEEHVRFYTSAQVRNVFIPREKTSNDTPDASHKRKLRRIFRNVCEQVEVNIPEDRGRKGLIKRAFITLEPNLGSGARLELERLMENGCRGVNDELYRMKQVITCDLFCNQHVYKAVDVELLREVDTSDCKVEIADTKKTPPDKRIHVSGDAYADVKNLSKKLQVVLCPEEVDASSLVEEDVTSMWMDKVLNKLTKQHFKHILRNNKAHAEIHYRRQAVIMYGKETDRESLKEDLRKFFSFALKTMFRELDISSRSGGQKGRAMRSLIRQYGPHLERLKTSTGVDNITVDLKRGLLFVDGSEESYESLISEVDNILKDLLDSAASEDDVIHAECGVCYCPPSDANSKPYRLAACGHFFCLACLKDHLKESGNSKKFPIACPECEESILLCDIKTIYPKEDERQELFTAGLDAYVASNSRGDIQFCPGPDCGMVYKKDDDGSTMECEECAFSFCNGCGEKPHAHGMTCKEFQISQKKTDDVEKWMQQRGVDAKKCPVCNTVIEKTHGCNHMTCRICKKHLCWKCLEVFNTDQECYAHLAKRHGGLYDDDPIAQDLPHQLLDYYDDEEEEDDDGDFDFDPYNARLEAVRLMRARQEVERQRQADAEAQRRRGAVERLRRQAEERRDLAERQRQADADAERRRFRERLQRQAEVRRDLDERQRQADAIEAERQRTVERRRRQAERQRQADAMEAERRREVERQRANRYNDQWRREQAAYNSPRPEPKPSKKCTIL